MRRGSAGAIRLAFSLHTAYGAHLSEESGVVAGRGIDSNPEAFAKSLDRYFPKLGRVGGVCASFGDAFVDRPSATAAEARRRRDALSRSLGAAPGPAARLCLDALEALGRTGD